MEIAVDEAKVWDLINDALDRMTFAQKRVWAVVRVPPQEWRNAAYGNASFWVVGLIGCKTIWYNPHEHGFELTPYRNFGQIDVAAGDQFDLEVVMQHLINELEKGYAPPVMSGPLPGEYEPAAQ